MEPIKPTLTKEEFWNKMQEKYPKEMKVFCEWIDKYKKDNNWNDLFPRVERKTNWMDIKFHHLPSAFQLGIFIEFMGAEDYDIEKVKELIEEEFMERSITPIFTA